LPNYLLSQPETQSAGRIWRHTNILVSTVKATRCLVSHSLQDPQPKAAAEMVET